MKSNSSQEKITRSHQATVPTKASKFLIGGPTVVHHLMAEKSQGKIEAAATVTTIGMALTSLQGQTQGQDQEVSIPDQEVIIREDATAEVMKSDTVTGVTKQYSNIQCNTALPITLHLIKYQGVKEFHMLARIGCSCKLWTCHGYQISKYGSNFKFPIITH